MPLNETLGILLQGKVSSWTRDIINEYHQNFPNAEILLSTWEDESTQNLPCKVVKSKAPPLPKPPKSNANFQIVGCKVGLKNLKADLIMKCRTDQFIHNKKIFEIFKNSCSSDKIMVTDLGTDDYRTSDVCQIGYRSVLLDFWNNIPLYDGLHYEEQVTYLTKYYVLNVKNDHQPWRFALKKYFCIKKFHEDFQIEWQKLNQFDEYRRNIDIAYSNSMSVDYE